MTVIVPLQPQPNLGLPPSDLPHDPATPRAVLAPSVVAAVAAVTLPTLPVLVSHDSDYCLAAKRKACCDDDDDATDPVRSPKRLKQDVSDALFGPPISTLASQEPVEFVLDPAYFTAAICSALPPPPTEEPQPTPVLEPAQPPEEQITLAAALQRTPSPLTAGSSVLFEPSAEDDTSISWKLPIDNMLEAVPGGDAAAAPMQIAPSQSEELIDIPPAALAPKAARPRPPPVYRITEPPLWKMACRARVEHVVTMYGISTVRATIQKEAARRSPLQSDATLSEPSTNRSSSPTSGLRLQIYTPSSFSVDSQSSNDTEPLSPLSPLSPRSELEMEDDVDMSFDLDDDTDSDHGDSDSDSEDDSEDDEDEPEIGKSVTALEHESIMDVALDSALKPKSLTGQEDTTSDLSRYPDPAPTHTVPMTITIESDPPPLPRLTAFPVWCLREYPEVRKLGTPACAPPHCRGILSRAALQAQQRLLAAPQSHFDWS